MIHNDIGDFFYTGISVDWTWGYQRSFAKASEIAYNHVHHLGQGWLSDMGGIYTLGRSEGTRAHHNWFHHIWAHTYGGWGLYTDEGSTGILFENNLVHDTKDASFHRHYGRDNTVRDNILAFSRDCQVRVSRADDKNPPAAADNVPSIRLRFEHNLVVWESGEAWRGPFTRLEFRSSSNLWWNYRGPATNFAGRTLAQWQAAGQEAGSLVADPGFEDAAARRFRLPAGSPAAAVGFQPFELRARVDGDPGRVESARSAPMPGFGRLPPWSL